MANIAVRRTESFPMTRDFDMFRALRDLARWDPFNELPSLPFSAIAEAPTLSPAFEVKETKEGYVFKADVPGIKESDLDISLTGNRITIGGQRESEQREAGDNYFCWERAYGTFTRGFTLPDGVDTDHVKAELKDGVLTVQFTKLPEAQTKRISLRPPEKGKA